VSQLYRAHLVLAGVQTLQQSVVFPVGLMQFAPVKVKRHIGLMHEAGAGIGTGIINEFTFLHQSDARLLPGKKKKKALIIAYDF